MHRLNLAIVTTITSAKGLFLWLFSESPVSGLLYVRKHALFVHINYELVGAGVGGGGKATASVVDIS